MRRGAIDQEGFKMKLKNDRKHKLFLGCKKYI